jgi:hypothetical protein
VADVRPDDEAEIVGVPASDSLYLKLALLNPAPIVTLVIVDVSAVFLKRPVVEVVLKLTVCPSVPAFAGLPNWSSSWTVIVLDVVLSFAVCAEVVKAKCVAAPATCDRSPKSVEPFVMPIMVAVPGFADVLRMLPELGSTEPFVDRT